MTPQDLITLISQDYDIPVSELAQRYLDKPDAAKKRGRRRKAQQPEEYLETEELEFEGCTYLVDLENNVYTYDTENPMLIGKHSDIGVVFFAHQDTDSSSGDAFCCL